MALNRSNFLRLLIILSLGLSSCTSTSQKKDKAEKPNIIFILLDDLGKEWISCYGADSIQTPVIDGLAKNGMRFTNAYSMPQCTPSRVTLLTGQYPYNNGWVNHYDVPRLGHGGRYDPELNPSFAKRMKEAGYATCIAGKWQLNDFRLEPEILVETGFDEYCMWTGGENGGPSKDASQLRYWDPYIHTKEGSKTYKGQFGEDIFSDFIIDFMKRNKDNPMMVYYPMCLPHGPLTTTPLEPNAPREEQHSAMVRYADVILGKLVKALEDLKIRDNTIIVWTTDNGSGKPFTGYIDQKPVKGGKMYVTENGINAPFVVNGPGLVPEGVVTDALVDFTDILPTFCELADVAPNKNFKYDGKSFAPLILGKKEDSERDHIVALGGHFAMLENDRVVSAHDYRNRVLRDKNYKVFVDTTGTIYELVDLKNDFYEQHNLLHSKEAVHVNALQKFEKILTQMPKEDGDPIYRQIGGSFYDHPAEALNKVARQGKGARPKCPIPEGWEE
nr:sulfatase-like hydrolase/transferase [Allomuricauda sp.]